MRKLYEINKDIEKLLDETFTVRIDDENGVNTETGEVINIAERLDALTVEKSEKIRSVAVYFDDVSAKLDALEEKIKSLTSMKKTLEREKGGLENYLLFATENKGFSDEDMEIKVTSSKRVDFTDETLIPEKYRKVKIETSISKADISKAIKGGEEVPGAVLNTYYKIKVV